MESGADKPHRPAPHGLSVGRGRPLAARAPRVCVRADAHKKIRGKTPTGKASFGLPTFLSEWRVRRAACKAALNPRKAAVPPAQAAARQPCACAAAHRTCSGEAAPFYTVSTVAE